jgi:aminoglycoside 3-N-acetyltransferase
MRPDAKPKVPLVTAATIERGIRELQLAGRPVEIHASLRSFGWVVGGPATVIDAFLGQGCTVLVPAFTSAFRASAPAGWRLAQNARDPADDTPADGVAAASADGAVGVDGAVGDVRPAEIVRGYTTDAPDIDDNMGAIPAAVLAMPGRRRGDHPSDSFAAIGPLGDALIRKQSPIDHYAPLRALASLDGAVVLMGLGLRKMTLLHLAEAMAGRRAFRRWSRGSDGRPIEVETGSCSKGFPNLEPLLRPLVQELDVGGSHWSVYPAAASLDVAAAAIAATPAITHCGRPDCWSCNDAVRGGPLLARPLLGWWDRSRAGTLDDGNR